MLSVHPEWLEYVGTDQSVDDGFTVNMLRIDIPSEHPEISDPLTISVAVDRTIFVSWFSFRSESRWHMDWVFYMPHVREHLSWTTEDEGFDIVIEWVERFLREEIAASIADGAFDEVSAEDMRAGIFRRGRTTTCIRSWRGSLDIDLPAPDP